MAPDIAELASNSVTSLSSIAVLFYALGYSPLSVVGADVAIVVGTIVALAGAHDLAAQFDMV